MKVESIKPFFSILFIIGTLFTLVFMQMEERRLGYVLLKMTREQRQVLEEQRTKNMQLSKLMRPQQIEKMAQSRQTLQKVQANQIIHLSLAPTLKAREIN